MITHDDMVDYVRDVVTQCATTHSRKLVNLTLAINRLSLGHHPDTGEPGYLVEVSPGANHFVASSELGPTYEIVKVYADAEALHDVMNDRWHDITGNTGSTGNIGGQGAQDEFGYAGPPPKPLTLEERMQEYRKNAPTVQQLSDEIDRDLKEHMKKSEERKRRWLAEKEDRANRETSPTPAPNNVIKAPSGPVVEGKAAPSRRTRWPELDPDNDDPEPSDGGIELG